MGCELSAQGRQSKETQRRTHGTVNTGRSDTRTKLAETEKGRRDTDKKRKG